MDGIHRFLDLFFLVRLGVVARLSAQRQCSAISFMNELAVRALAAAGNLGEAIVTIGDGSGKLGTGMNAGDSAVGSRRRTPRTARPSRGQVNPELVGRGLLPCLAAKREAFPQRLSHRLHLCLRLRLVDMIDPVGRRRNGPGGEPAAMARMPAMPEPGPSPVFGSFSQVCPQRVSLDVATDREEMLVGLDRKRLESSLVERPRAERAMRMVPSHRVRHGQAMHEPRKSPSACGQSTRCQWFGIRQNVSNRTDVSAPAPSRRSSKAA